MKEIVLEILYSEKIIQKQVREMGQQICKDYEGEEIVMICVLKGANPFFSDLIKYQNPGTTYFEYLTASSYKDDLKSSSVSNVYLHFQTCLRGKHIIVVDEVVDSGLTLSEIHKKLHTHQPKSIHYCVLVNKNIQRNPDILYMPFLKYVGFTVGADDFLVGYGMDYKGLYRNLPYIAALKSK